MSVEIDPVTFEYARNKLDLTGFQDIIFGQGDRGLGYPDRTTYDRFCLTAACAAFPPSLIEQFGTGVKIIMLVIEKGIQNLMLFVKTEKIHRSAIHLPVLYVPL